ncbi:UNVERIFIED_CONTAM: rsgA [Trichonephila clavipes]
MRGIVTKSTGSWYQVMDDDGQNYECRIKGKFRTQGIKTTNPIAVGDFVEFELEPGQQSGVINTLLPRRNYIIRRSVNLSSLLRLP